MKNLQSFDEFITEGTWSLEKSKINQYIKELKSITNPKQINQEFYNKWWNIVGDDRLYDFLDAAKENKRGEWEADIQSAIGRLEELKKMKIIK